MSELSIKTYFGLFTSKWNAFIFISYMILFINQGILVTATKTADNKYNYSTITTVLLTECVKLIISIAIYSKDNNLISDFLPHIFNNIKVLFYYFIPAFLYCLYNNLAFINLVSYDPTTYYILLQFRVVITGLIYQILFKRTLNTSQWFCLLLLTFGCIIKQFGGIQDKSFSIINFNLLLILIQVFCSCFAGVYNEYLLKDIGSQVHIMIQNVFMYFDSIVCNIFILIITGELSKLSEASQNIINIIIEPKIIILIFNNALCGIVTSVFLKSLNSILKTFASALELVFTAILCWIIFGFPIDIFTIISVIIVSYSIYKYSQNPVVNNNYLPHHKNMYDESNDLIKNFQNDNHKIILEQRNKNAILDV